MRLPTPDVTSLQGNERTMAERFHPFTRWAEEYGKGAMRPRSVDPSHRPIDTGTRPRACPLRQVQVLRRFRSSIDMGGRAVWE